MENITKERLMQAGWYLGRIIDISEFENKYKEIGMEMPGIVKDFLRTYGIVVCKEGITDKNTV